MADTVAQVSISTVHDGLGGMWGSYWSNISKAVTPYVDVNQDISFTRTTDKGANWTKTLIEGGTVRQLAAWYDKETPGDTGTFVHIVWLDSSSGNLYYRAIDVDDGTYGTPQRTISSTLTISTTNVFNRLAITKTVSGNIIVAVLTQVEIVCWKSADNFATAGTVIADPFEAAADEDWLLLYPAATADSDDAVGIYWDDSASEISAKLYDDSNGASGQWDETSIAGSMTHNLSTRGMDAAVRHSDSKIILGAHSNDDDAGDDLLTWELTVDTVGAGNIGVSAKANVFTNQSESAEVGIVINQQNDDVYLSYLKGGTWQDTTDVVYHLSDDNLTTWEAESAYSEDAADDLRLVAGGRTVGNDGGRIQFMFNNDDTFEFLVNETNDIEIVAASIETITPDKWHPDIERPYPQKVEVNDY